MTTNLRIVLDSRAKNSLLASYRLNYAHEAGADRVWRLGEYVCGDWKERSLWRLGKLSWWMLKIKGFLNLLPVGSFANRPFSGQWWWQRPD